MITNLRIRSSIGALAVAVTFFAACAAPVSSSAAPRATGVVVADGQDAVEGARLWSDNCTRCHNMRPPEQFGAMQWDVIVHHMRVRGNITGGDARAIVAFLKGL